MNMISPERFFLRGKKEKLRKAVAQKYSENQEKFIESFNESIKALEEWSGKYSWMMGYKIKDLEIQQNETDYGRALGLGVFLECEKYDDIRGWILHVVETAKVLSDTNDEIQKANILYAEEVGRLKDALLKSNPHEYFRMYPKELTGYMIALESLKEELEKLDEIRDTLNDEDEGDDDD